MPTTVDGFGTSSNEVTPFTEGFYGSSNEPQPYSDGSGIGDNVSSTIPSDYILTGISPSPAPGGGLATLTGVGLLSVQRVVMGGVDTSFTVVSDTRIDARVPVLPVGQFSIYVEGP